MRTLGLFALGLVFFSSVTALAATQETGAASLSVLPGYEQASNDADEYKEFDAHDMWDGKRWVSREGRYTKRFYTLKEGANRASPLQIGRNFANALKAAGATVLFQGATEAPDRNEYLGHDYHVYAKATQAGKTVWFLCMAGQDGVDYEIRAIEEQAMVQGITASDMAAALAKDGFISLDIHFDTAKATIKPESQSIVDQIAQLLKSDAKLKVSIEGHTDNAGTPAGNKKLSTDRAKAVVSAVAAKGVAANRMTSVGWGQDKPVADNRTEEGRAKNRRVEVVKK
jgi:outer membrane protein OmpA-like peptidoglycan-associated protein